MAEEQFTSRRARREAERLKAEQAFEARDTPEQSSDDASALRAQLLTPAPAQDPATPSAQPKVSTGAGEDDTVREPIDADPAPQVSHERGALASDHPLEERPPVNAEDRLDPQRTPLPHFESRAARKRYLREHGLSLEGDLSTGAMPVVAAPEDSSAEVSDADSAEAPPAPTREPAATADKPESASTRPSAPTSPRVAAESSPSGEPEYVPARNAEPESYDTAGFGGAAAEVAARDFESPVTADSSPRPVSSENEPYDALSKPLSALESDDGDVPTLTTAEITGTGAADGADSRSVEQTAAARPESATADPAPRTETPKAKAPKAEAPKAEKSTAEAPKAEKPKPRSKGSKSRSTETKSRTTAPESPTPEAAAKETTGAPEGRSRRMPIVQPPSTSGVRVVTASSAQIPAAADDRSSRESASATDTGTDENTPGNQTSAPAETGPETSPDDAARALAANPETRPMDTVPEAWSLPNANFEDEETENPPAERIRASTVTGHDGRILVGEEPSKVPFIVLGIAATVAVALIVIALFMLQ